MGMYAALQKPTSERAIELVAPHCDILERLEHVPPSAQARGLWLKTLPTEMKERGLLDKYREYFPADDHKTLKYYWAGDYLLRAAVAGALVAGPESLHQGMFELSRKNARRFAESLIGRTLIRLLSPKPKQLMEQGIAARRQTISWGEWALVRAEPGHAEVRMRNEYMWIESFVAGAWVGSMQTLGIEATVKCELENRFNGTATIDWAP